MYYAKRIHPISDLALISMIISKGEAIAAPFSNNPIISRSSMELTTNCHCIFLPYHSLLFRDNSNYKENHHDSTILIHMKQLTPH